MLLRRIATFRMSALHTLPKLGPMTISRCQSGRSIPKYSNPLVWIDCEMTGLDRQQDTVMSLCCIVTDSDLQPLDSFGFDRVVHHSEAQLANMSAWCLDVHGKSGLTRACLKSTTSAEVVAKDLLEYIQKLVPTPHTGVLAGNCVHCDRDFLSKGPYKKVVDYLHYSIFDVKSLTTAATMWTSGELEGKPERKGLHQARADILEAIEMAKFYRSVFFANKRSPKLTSEP